MKKIILALVLVGTLIIVTTGCGGDDDKKELTAEEVTLEYKTSGAYDLSQYIAPAENKTNIYVKNTYINNDAQPNDTTYPTTQFDINTTTIKQYDSDDTNITYTILNDRIKLLNKNDTIRYANIGDYISKTIIKTNTNGNNLNMSSLCKLNKHIESKEINNNTYTDIVEIVCTSKFNSTGKTNGIDSSVTRDGTKTYYLAKEVGKISEIQEDCETTIFNKVDSNNCKKIVTEITNIN